ncbi:hypothetical protein HanRHA438_Chr15g0702781 [Helianthus annuus]|nr:hypothetical protein HanRHA438_Chr15g0702781 [Helianthus annuus]
MMSKVFRNQKHCSDTITTGDVACHISKFADVAVDVAVDVVVYVAFLMTWQVMWQVMWHATSAIF